jgi:hypothetical protein
VKHPPLELDTDDWRSRWLVTEGWERLHRVSSITWDPDFQGQKIVGRGVTVCGKRGRLQVPGIISRMGLTRCVRCCRILGIPEGEGAPFNAFEGDHKNA